MHDRTPCTIFALLLGAALPTSAIAAETPTIGVTVAAELGDEGKLRTTLEKKAKTLAYQRGLWESSKSDAQLTIQVRWTSKEHKGYSVVATASGGESTSDARFECRTCTEQQLVAETEAHLIPLLDRLVWQLAARPTAPAPISAAPSNAEPQQHRLGSLGWAGATTAALGAGAFLGGATLLLVGHKRLADQPFNIRYFEEAGYALLGGGVALVATGTTLLILERTRKHKHNRDKKRVAIIPVLAPTLLGGAAAVRF